MIANLRREGRSRQSDGITLEIWCDGRVSNKGWGASLLNAATSEAVARGGPQFLSVPWFRGPGPTQAHIDASVVEAYAISQALKYATAALRTRQPGSARSSFVAIITERTAIFGSLSLILNQEPNAFHALRRNCERAAHRAFAYAMLEVWKGVEELSTICAGALFVHKSAWPETARIHKSDWVPAKLSAHGRDTRLDALQFPECPEGPATRSILQLERCHHDEPRRGLILFATAGRFGGATPGEVSADARYQR